MNTMSESIDTAIKDNPNAHCVIIGGGHAAASLGPTVRAKGWQGKITIVSEEGLVPYHRPPLSKDYFAQCLNGSEEERDTARKGLYIRKPDFYEKKNINFKLNARATRIDREKKTLELDNGEKLSYDKLALATGATPRKLNIPGSDLDGIFYMRGIQDADAVIKSVSAQIKKQQTSKAVIIGGGYIGLEAAASLRKVGVEVTILEAADRILQRVTGPVMSDFYRRVHQEEGVTIHEDIAAIESFKGQTRVEKISLADGSEYEADLVLVGIGVIPNTQLAEGCGLETNNGIRVNEFAQTSDPDIFAAGDCANFYDSFYGLDLRLESVPHANGQAATAGAAICGVFKPYSAFPWFWSDQYDINLQIAGLSIGFDEIVIRGNLETARDGSAYYFKGDQLIAVDAINRPKEFMLAKKHIPLKTSVDKEQLKDESRDISEIFSG